MFRRHRRRLALIALLGLLFQQVAMAVYVCPMEGNGATGIAAASMTMPCTSPATLDKARCDEHCHPLPKTLDHRSVPTVPLALLATGTWSRVFSIVRSHLPAADTWRAYANARAAPPLTIQHCSFQI